MKKNIFIVLIILWVGFIFYNSMQIGEVSSEASGRYTKLAMNILNSIGINIEQDNLSLLIRKLAHIFEFFVLSILIFIYLDSFKFKYKTVIAINIISCLAIAFLDESLQLFIEGRYGSIIDVGIDSIGIILSNCLTLLYYLIKIKRKKLE